MVSLSASPYRLPERWALHDAHSILPFLVEAKASVRILQRLPYLPQWIETVHEEQLRQEAVGTTRIEGAEFNEQEQEEALAVKVLPENGLTHSQQQLVAAQHTYRWMGAQPADRPINEDLILEIHRRIVTGCDDNHCEPGALRRPDQNVSFEIPRCRGVEGGDDCRLAFRTFCRALASDFQLYDPIIQALAAHYHIGAMHPFSDGNGRTARAVEAFMLRRAGVHAPVMVSLANYYYEHRDGYLSSLSESRSRQHDITPFLRFALPAISNQCDAVSTTIVANNQRILYKEFASSLYGRLISPRRRVLTQRQLNVLELLQDSGAMSLDGLLRLGRANYGNLKFSERAQMRDLSWLLFLKAIRIDDERMVINLNWPQQFSDTWLLSAIENMPRAASSNHPVMTELSQLLNRRL